MVAESQSEIKVQSVFNRQGVTVGNAGCFGPSSALIASVSELKVVCYKLEIRTDMMTGEGLFQCFFAKPFPHFDVTAINAPVPVNRVAFPPGVFPVYGDTPVVAHVHIYADIGYQSRIVKHIGFERCVKWQHGSWLEVEFGQVYRCGNVEASDFLLDAVETEHPVENNLHLRRTQRRVVFFI